MASSSSISLSQTRHDNEPAADVSTEHVADTSATIGGSQQYNVDDSSQRGGGARKHFKSTRDFLRRIDPSLILDNTGSVARDHLAAERTFLAYVRTSLAFASAGVALVQLFNLAKNLESNRRLSKYSRPLGATMVLFGIFVLSIGTMRYFQIQTAMTRGKFPAARFTIAIQTIFLLALVVVVFSFLIASR